MVHNTIGSTVHSMPLNSFEHCICTTTMTVKVHSFSTMTNIWIDRNSNLVPPGYSPSRCDVAHFYYYFIENIKIEFADEFNFSGLTKHKHLKWDLHINKIASKILNFIGIMYRLKHMVPSEIILTIYNGLIKPHILYGLKCWGFNQERILKLQKKAMRIICSSGYLSHSEPPFKKLNVLKIDGMFKLQLLTFCFDLINNNLPAYFINISSLLQPVIYHHNIRQKRNYSVAGVKHVFAQKCMRFCIPDILNKSSSLITDKIKNHGRKGFSVYLKCFLVNAYNSICLIPNCYFCSKIAVS